MINFAEALQLFLLASLGSFIALLGGVIFLYNRTLSRYLEKHSIPFAAGVLITVALLTLLPEAFHQIGERAFLFVLLSFFGAYIFEYFFIDIHHHEESHHERKYTNAIPLVIIGDTIHNFIDGIAIAVAFFVNPGLGLVTALSTFLHEIPHEIGDFGILLRAKWSKAKILQVNLISAAFTVIGAFLTYFVAQNTFFIGMMLSISAGIFLYLGAIDFLPQLKDEYKSKVGALIPLTIGVIVMVLTLMAIPHSHEEEVEEVHSDENVKLQEPTSL